MERMFIAGEQLSGLPALEPGRQADVLARLAQEARLVRLALSARAACAQADQMACSFERALGQVIDADADDSEQARLGLESVLVEARSAGFTVSATLDEMTLDGVLGAQRLPVLTAVISAG